MIIIVNNIRIIIDNRQTSDAKLDKTTPVRRTAVRETGVSWHHVAQLRDS